MKSSATRLMEGAENKIGEIGSEIHKAKSHAKNTGRIFMVMERGKKPSVKEELKKLKSGKAPSPKLPAP